MSKDDRGTSTSFNKARRWFLIGTIGSFIGANMYLLGRRLFDRPGLELIVQGPFDNGVAVPITAADNNFVDPRHLVFDDLGNVSSLATSFYFKGPESASRRMAVTISAVDSHGVLLGSDRKVVGDQRLRKEKVLFSSGGKVIYENPYNCVSIPLAADVKVDQVRLTFEEIH